MKPHGASGSGGRQLSGRDFASNAQEKYLRTDQEHEYPACVISRPSGRIGLHYAEGHPDSAHPARKCELEDQRDTAYQVGKRRGCSVLLASSEQAISIHPVGTIEP